MHSKTNFKLSDIGIELFSNNGRSGKLRLHQTHHANRMSNEMFAHRAIAEEDKWPAGIVETASVAQFKLKLHTLFMLRYFID